MGISTMSFGLLFLGVPAEATSFPEIWYREVILGDHTGASEDYQTLFLSPPSTKVSAETRQRAAYRAGLCFERLGQLEYARSAYTSVPTLGPGSSPAVEEALLRLKRISVGEASDSPPAAPIDLAIAKQLEAQRAARAERQRSLGLLTKEVSARDENARERREVFERLSRLGVDLLPQGAQSPGAVAHLPGIIDVLKPALREADVPRVEAALGERFQEKALLALTEGNRGRASAHVHAAVLLQGKTALSDWCASIMAEGFSAAGAAAAAEGRLEEERFQRVVALRRDVRAALGSAELLAFERGRPDLALVELDKVRERLERADRSLRADPEARSLEGRATRLLLGLGRGGGDELALSRLWRDGREDMETLVSLAEKLFSLAQDEAPFLGRLELVPAAGEARSVALAEAQRLAAVARDAATRGDKEGSERSLREAEWIQRWMGAPGGAAALGAERTRAEVLEVKEGPAGERRS